MYCKTLEAKVKETIKTGKLQKTRDLARLGNLMHREEANCFNIPSQNVLMGFQEKENPKSLIDLRTEKFKEYQEQNKKRRLRIKVKDQEILAMMKEE
jgi:hypothetical protein